MASLPPVQTSHPTLRKEVYEILAKKKDGQAPDDLESEHSDFKAAYPRFWDKLMESDVDEEQLFYLVSMYENVQRNKTDYESASKRVGQRMFDKFVKPGLPSDGSGSGSGSGSGGGGGGIQFTTAAPAPAPAAPAPASVPAPAPPPTQK